MGRQKASILTLECDYMNFPTKDEITEIIVKDIVGPDKSIKDLNGNWFIKTLIVALRESIWVVVTICRKIWDSLTAVTATGNDLDNKGKEIDVLRKSATKARHLVTIGKSKPVAMDLYIPDNFLVTTTALNNNPPIKFTVVKGQNKYIKKGEQTVDGVVVECVEYGIAGNVSNGAINLIAQSGFDTCSNSRISTRGVDIEDDNSYRGRILMRKQDSSKGGTKKDWERWAKEVEGVGAATAYPCGSGNGTVDIIILDNNLDFPTEGLLEKTREYLYSKYLPADLWREDGNAVTIMSPKEKNIPVKLTNCVFRKGYDVTENADTINILIESLKELLKTDYDSNVVRKNDIIVALKLAYDKNSSSDEPILYDFEVLEPESNIFIADKEKACIKQLEIVEK